MEVYSTVDENVYELTEVPSQQNENQQKQCQKSLEQGMKLFEDKWLLIMICLLVVIFILLVILVGICGSILQQSNFKCTSATSSSSLTGTSYNINSFNGSMSQLTPQIYEQINTTQMLILKSNGVLLPRIINTLSNLQDTSTSTAAVVANMLLVVQELLALQNASSTIPTSCLEIKERKPSSPSGAYVLSAANDSDTHEAYCHMGGLCGSGGGWTRLAYLDMTDATQNCPSGFRLYQSGGVRACGRPANDSGSCASVQFPSNGISYTKVCGRVVGYQFASPDAIHLSLGSNQNNLNSEYVDGVSITQGSPRQHVWTLMASNHETHGIQSQNCPCYDNAQVPSYIGHHYYCESGNSYTPNLPNILHTYDPLWDGQNCNQTACCSVPGLPWFHRDYGNATTTDYLELRVCSDQGTDNEDVPVSYYEIYVK